MTRVRFLLDEHIAHAVANALRRRGVDVLTSAGAGLLGVSDEEVLAAAKADGRVVVTHDGDFLRLHEAGMAHSGVAYCEQGSRTIGQLVAALLLIHEALDADDMVGHVEFL